MDFDLEPALIQDELWKNEVPVSENRDECWAEYAVTDADMLNIFEDLDLFDIDVILAKQEETLQYQKKRRRRGTSTWKQRLEKWGGGIHVDWDIAETTEWRVLEQLGYTYAPLNKETRDNIIRAARHAKLSYQQKIDLATQITNAHAQLALLPPLNTDEQEDPYTVRRQALQAEITKVEQALANKRQWLIIEQAVRFLGQDIEPDELMIRDNCLIRW